MVKNILTIDLEDWYQSSIELFPEKIKSEDILYPSEKVIHNTKRLLSILEEYHARATFFVLGTVAEKNPHLVKSIQASGHEVAVHGYAHKLVYKQTREEFRNDLRRSVDVVENIIAGKVLGYRAPYFSIREDSLWVLEVLKEEGMKYDASIFPLKRKLYGVKNSDKIYTNGIIEFPASKTNFFGYEFPFGGGGYLRLFPYIVTQWAVEKLNKQGKPAMIYIHPYEIDTEDFQDYELGSSIKTKFTRFTQEVNRDTVENKIKRLLKNFQFTSISDLLD